MMKSVVLPTVAGAKYPDFLFEKGAWTRAAAIVERTDYRFLFLSDGEWLHAGMDAVINPDALNSPAPDRPGGFPRGDRIELFVKPESGHRFRFAMDILGRAYEDCDGDGKWTCDWIAEPRISSYGWRAVARIPFRSLGCVPAPGLRLRALPLLVVAAKKLEIFGFGGVPDDPSTWGEFAIGDVNDQK